MGLFIQVTNYEALKIADKVQVHNSKLSLNSLQKNIKIWNFSAPRFFQFKVLAVIKKLGIKLEPNYLQDSYTFKEW